MISTLLVFAMGYNFAKENWGWFWICLLILVIGGSAEPSPPIH